MFAKYQDSLIVLHICTIFLRRVSGIFQQGIFNRAVSFLMLEASLRRGFPADVASHCLQSIPKNVSQISFPLSSLLIICDFFVP